MGRWSVMQREVAGQLVYEVVVVEYIDNKHVVTDTYGLFDSMEKATRLARDLNERKKRNGRNENEKNNNKHEH